MATFARVNFTLRGCLPTGHVFVVLGMIPVGKRISSAELLQSRRAGLTVPLQMLDGTRYWSPGGGITTARLGAEVVDNADRYREWIARLEEYVRAELPNFKPQIEESLKRKIDRFSFKLGFRDGQAFAGDQGLGIALQLGQVPS